MKKVGLTALTLDWLHRIAYALLIASAIPVGLAIHQFIKARHAAYYILRREALGRAGRWVLAALVLQALAVALLVVPPRLVAIVHRPEEPVLDTPTPALTATVTPTPRPTRTPTVTPTRRPTATPPFIPTPTPTVSPPDTALTPIPSAVPAGEDARITLVALAIEKDERDRPVEPGDEFPPGDHWVYLFFAYEGMENGVVRTFAWYKEGEFIEFCSDTGLWEWGQRGATWYGCRLPGGWEPGRYEIHVFIETLLQGIAQFVIAEE